MWQVTVYSGYVSLCVCVCVRQTLNRNILKYPQTVYQRWMQRVTPSSVNQSEVEPLCVYLKHFGTLSLRIWLQGLKKQLMSSRSLPESTNMPTAAHEHKHTPAAVHHFLAFGLSSILAAPSVPASRPLALWLITNKSPTVTTRRAVFLSTSPSLSSSFSPTSLLLLWHFRWPSSSSSCSHCSGLNWRIAHSLALNLFFSKFY